MNDKMPVPDKAEARRITAIDKALQLQKNSSSPELLVHNAKIIEKYLAGESPQK